MQVKDIDDESFIPDIIPPEVKSTDGTAATPLTIEVPESAKNYIKVSPPPPRPEKPVAPAPFHIHHALIGLCIAGASLAVFLVPTLKPTTKVAIAGLGVTVGAVLAYDDIIQHQENGCGLESIINFTPCKEVTVVKKQ